MTFGIVILVGIVGAAQADTGPTYFSEEQNPPKTPPISESTESAHSSQIQIAQASQAPQTHVVSSVPPPPTPVDENTYFTPGAANKESQSVQIVVPKTLQECIQIALERHFPIEIAKDKVSLAKRKLVKALRDLLPAMNFIYEDGMGALTQGDELLGYNSRKFRFAMRQPLFRGGSLVNQVKSENAGLHSAQGEYDKVFTDLALEVATAYFNYARTKAIVSYRENLAQKAKEAVKLSDVKLKAELVSEIEHLNVQSQTTRIEGDVEQSKEQVALAELELQKLLNLDTDETIDVYSLEYYRQISEKSENPLIQKDLSKIEAESQKDTTEKSDEKYKQDDKQRLDGFIKMAYEHRPEFIIEREKVRSRRFAEKSVKGAFLPKADFILELGRLSEAPDELSKEPHFNPELRAGFEVGWNAGGNSIKYTFDNQITAPSVTTFASGSGSKTRKNTLSVGLLDDLDLFSRSKEAEIQTKEAILELELAERQVLSEVKEAYYNYKRSLIQVKSAMKRLVYRKKLVELAQHRSEVNEIQLSEYLQAEMDLIDEQNTLYQAMGDYFLAKASLNKAVGTRDFLTVDEWDIDQPLKIAPVKEAKHGAA